MTAAAASVSAAEKTEPIAAVTTVSRVERMQKYERMLIDVWKDVWEALHRREDTLNVEFTRLQAALEAKGYTDNVRLFLQEWDRLVAAYDYEEDGRDRRTVRGRTELHERVTDILDRFADVAPLPDGGTIGDFLPADANLTAAEARRIDLEERCRDLLMTDVTGKRLHLFPDELKNDPSLTPDMYMDRLAGHLKTPHNLGLFLRLFFHYTIDTDDEKQPLRKGSAKSQKEYWQTPSETLMRVENNCMLGDCDDITALCCALLSRMGKNPVGLYIHGYTLSHYTCIWAEKRGDGYIVCDMGTHGFLEDGLLRMTFEIGHENEIERLPVTEGGHKTLKEALLHALKRYPQHHGYELDDIRNDQARIQSAISTWSTTPSPIDRIKQMSLSDLEKNLFPPEPEPMVTAGTVAPPPPPE